MRASLTSISFALAAAVLAAGCSSTGSKGADTSSTSTSQAAAPAGAKRIVKSRDGRFEGEVIGTAAPDSKFAKLAIGMSSEEVQEVMSRAPDRFHTYESGKRWIPFYFGNDARRMQALYKGEGCLIFTGGNIWGGGGTELIQIEVDTSGACYQP
ncbi:hypothetical protein AACH06_06400 [Ideonella sp. DXS29W]|uniref:Lipoprotein n=1 Tax=Ideonella lacteola TaxID=2984193 RepID=A0ABU9BNK9_9BURK